MKTSETIYLSFFLFFFLVPVALAVGVSTPLSEVTGSFNVNQISGNVGALGNANYPLGHVCSANFDCSTGTCSQCNSTFCEGNVCCNQACTGACGNCGTYDCSTGTCSCSGDKSAIGASCTSGLTCCSTYCDGNTYKCANQPSPGGGTGGSGGAGGTTTTTLVPVSETETISPITNGTTGTFNFTSSNTLKITSVGVTVNETVTDAHVTVSESSLPAGANAAIGVDGIVYKYLDITTNVPNSKIQQIKINFKVEKSWITANSVDIASISMKRYVSGSWVSLPTVKVSEDATYVYFEATCPGFSLFAITGLKLIVTTTSTVPPTSSSSTSSSTSTTTTVSLPAFGPSMWLSVFLVLIIIGVIIFGLKRKAITKAVMPS